MTVSSDTPVPATQELPTAPEPMALVNSATRHLAAGAYLDDRLRRLALSRVLAHPKRSVAPSAGFDLAFVLTHCLRARRAAILRDSLEVLLLLVGLQVAVAVTVEVWVGLALWSALLVVATAMLKLVAERLITGVRGRAGDNADVGAGADDAADNAVVQDRSRAVQPWERWLVDQASQRPRAAAIAAGLALVVLVAVLLRAALADLPATVKAGGGTGPLLVQGATVVALAVLVVPLGWHLWRQRQISRLTRGHPAAVRSAASDAMIRFAKAVAGNTTVHADYRPFIGAGEQVSRWAFAVRVLPARPPAVSTAATGLDAADREFAEPPFTAKELLKCISDDLEPLDREHRPERRIPDLTVRSHVYVPSDEVSHPVTDTDQATMDEVIRQPTAPTRHYLVVQVAAWDGELVTTVHLHAALQGMTLYLESTTTALAPCQRAYRSADLSGGTGAPAYARAIGVGLIEAPSTVVLAPWRLARQLHHLSRAVWDSVLVDRHWWAGYDYGARVSLREAAQGYDVTRHQLQDVGKYDRIVERRVLTCVLDFFDDKGVDTSELRQRVEAVLNVGAVNVGVMNTGSGSVTATTAAGTVTAGGGVA